MSLVIIFGIMLYQHYKHGMHSYFLLFAIFFGVLTTVIYNVDYLTYSLYHSDSLRIRLHLSLFFLLNFLYFLWYLHYEFLESITPPMKRILPIFSLLSIGSAVSFLEFVGLLKETYTMSIVSHISYLSGIYAFSFAFFVIRKTHGLVKERVTRVEEIGLI